MTSVLKVSLMALMLVACEESNPNHADTFTGAGVLNGSSDTKSGCNFSDTSVWVVVEDKGECIRYFHSGLAAANDVVVIYLHGDRVWAARRAQRNGKPLSSPDRLKAHVSRNSDLYGLPYIRLSRPGTYGSSGNHNQRRSPRNVKLVNAAFDAIKKKHQINKFAVGGQSGGGHLATALLAMRNDILCVVSTAGVMSVWERVYLMDELSEFIGPHDFFDPIEHVNEIVRDLRRRVLIIGDPNDSFVPFQTQRSYFTKLTQAGHKAWLMEAKGKGSSNHGMAHVAVPAVFACGAGKSIEEIKLIVDRI